MNVKYQAGGGSEPLAVNLLGLGNTWAGGSGHPL